MEIKNLVDLRNTLNYVYAKYGLRLNFDRFGFFDIYDLEKQLLKKYGYIDLDLKTFLTKKYDKELADLIEDLIDININKLC